MTSGVVMTMVKVWKRTARKQLNGIVNLRSKIILGRRIGLVIATTMAGVWQKTKQKQ